MKYFLEPLSQRQHDPDENVRMEVIQAIVGAAKKDPTHMNTKLLESVKERTLDKKVIILIFYFIFLTVI